MPTVSLLLMRSGLLPHDWECSLLRRRVLAKNQQYTMRKRLRKSFQLPFTRSQVLTYTAVSFRHKWSNWNTVKKVLSCNARHGCLSQMSEFSFETRNGKCPSSEREGRREREHILFSFGLMSTRIRVTPIIQYIFMSPSYKVNIPDEILNSHF